MNKIFRVVLCSIALTTVLFSAARAQTAPAKSPRIPALKWEERSDWVNVKTDIAPGAVGDGVADDTAAIEKAFSEVKDGASVYFPPGTYRITQTLHLSGRLLGVLIVGSGRDTKIVWDGEAGGKMLKINGVAYSRFVGMEWDGRGKAGIGFWYNSDLLFMTEVRHQHLAFRGFTQAGILNDPERKVALSEPMFENCIFEDCKRGVSFLRHNDYDFTFDGCEFRRCDIGIECLHGNFYARNCHFEDSRDTDISVSAEHGSSVRRCTSKNSNSFIRFYSIVAPIVVQDCRVDGWKNSAGAVSLNGAPALIFDCVFTSPPAPAPGGESVPISVAKNSQRLLVSNNRVVGTPNVVGGAKALLYEIPAGKRGGALRSAEQSFFQESARIPRRVFDAKKDFGAKGDGASDDTLAVQKAIDAASKVPDSIAYFPEGRYVVSKTIQISGRDYFIGGGGWNTHFLWRGVEGGTMVEVRNPQRIVLQNLSIGAHGGGAMNNAIDIHQIGANGPSFMTYDNISIFGTYQKMPFKQGLRFSNLGAGEVVLMPHVQGNLGFSNCARATILGNSTFEGSINVEGKEKVRDGMLGFQTRLATIVTYGLYLRDSNNIVMSDFYMEQSDNNYWLEGSPGDAPGRATVSGAKFHMFTSPDESKNSVVDIRNYKGQVFMGPYQFYIEPKIMRIKQQGENAVEMYLIGCSYYDVKPDVKMGASAKLSIIGNEAIGMESVKFVADDVMNDAMSDKTLAALSLGLDDLRRLGETDLQLNYHINMPPIGKPNVKPSTPAGGTPGGKKPGKK